LGVGFAVEVAGRLVRISGELDIAVVADLLAEVAPLTSQPGDMSIDLSRLTFMDSSGLQALLTIARDVRGTLILLDPRPAVRRVFEITGTEDRFAFSAGRGDQA
jgi:anti-anti-sigma factor